MKSIAALVMFFSVVAAQAAESPRIERHYINSWEKDTGYAAVTQVGDTLHVSGLACAGENMQAAVTTCYRRLGDILKRFGASPDRIVKEPIYTTDIEALKKCIPDRKNFFNNTDYPAATWVQVVRLFNPEHLLEVEVAVQL